MRPSVFIAILTAHGRDSFVDFARRTWIKDCPFDYKLIYGEGTKRDPLQDELFCLCPDTYFELALKNQEAFRYALDHKYDFCLRCCDDTFMFPERLTSLEEYDYAGKLIGIPRDPKDQWYRPWGQGYLHGGCGIWLSRKVMEKLVADPWGTYDPVNPRLKGEYVDDIWMGEVLQGNLGWGDSKRNGETYASQGIKLHNAPGFVSMNDPKFPDEIDWNMAVSVHYHSLDNQKLISQI